MNLTMRALSSHQGHGSDSYFHVDLHYGKRDCRDEPGKGCLGGVGAYARLERPAKYADEGKDHDDIQGESSCRVCPPPEWGERIPLEPGWMTLVIIVIGAVEAVGIRSVVIVVRIVVRHD